ncbi:MAG: ATP-binding protein [Humidesulfovibrio sp.]
MKPAAPPEMNILERTFRASHDEVESFIVDMRRHLSARGLGAGCFGLELMAREALGNAVRHGCKSDPSQSISARLSIGPDRVRLCVSDSGPGYDWRNTAICLPDPDSETGRGLCILKNYADTVEFNDAGNMVCVTKALPLEEERMKTDKEGLVRISLESSVSAKNAQTLRELFKQHVQDGARNIELDFGRVESIDSVGIGLLVATHNSLSKVGGSLSLCGVGQDIYQLFTLMRLDKHFHVGQAGAQG